MSAEPSNPSGLPGRNRPHLSDLSRETTEDDLWNLEDEAPVVQARQPRPTPSPRPSAPAETTDEPQVPATAEPTAPAPRGLTSPVKPPLLRSAPSDEIGELDESEPEPTPTRSTRRVPAARSAPAPADATVSLGSSIDEEVAIEPAPVEESPSAAPEAAPPEAVAPTVVEEDEEEEPPLHEPPAYDREEPDAAEPKETRSRAAAPPAAKATLPRPRMNRREVIGIASFGVVVMIAALWVLTRFFTQLSFIRDSDGKPDYPLKGELARVASADTFWREPVRGGENRDVARREVVLIPVLELTLDPEHSAGGALRVLFRNAQGEPVGDPITYSFGAGRFQASGSPTISFAATDGFIEDGDFQAYRTGKGKYWTADVLEGPPGESPASAFKKLSSIPLLPDRR